MQTVGINSFVLRQCEPDFAGTKVFHSALEAMRPMVEEMVNRNALTDGGATFCKIAVVRNRWPIHASYALITDQNRHLLKSEYVTRTEGELPYLSRFFEGLDSPVANYLHVILYTRKQLEKEFKKTGNNPPSGSDFDIISVNAEMGTSAAPMSPSTMLRNHMGTEFGGNGKEINREEFLNAVAFWNRHANIR